jgi:hypothetical protein
VFVFVRHPPGTSERARRLRADGWSVRAIARELKIAQSTASLWVRDVPLSDEQRRRLDQLSDRQRAGNAARARRAREARLDAQQLGRTIARIDEPLHRTGCMLYWAEGSKSRNQVVFVNSDVHMMRVFLEFLHQCCGVPDDSIALSINCHLGNGVTAREIERWWLERLDLPDTCLRKAIVNRPSRASKRVHRPLIYGTARLVVSSTRIVQSIYGAIQEYAGLERPEWTDLRS